MFIIVGHDRNKQQVMVHDTSDHTTVPASYAILRKAVNKGYLVKGIDNTGQIICNEPDVLAELKIQLQAIMSKILLLKLNVQKAIELIFPICEKYGLAEDYYDLSFEPETFSLMLYLIGKKVYFTGKQNKTVHSLKYTKDFDKIENDEVQYLLKELYKIPLSYEIKDLIITDIRRMKHNYYIRFSNAVVLGISLRLYDTDYTPTLADDPVAADAYRHYLRKLAKYRPEGPYFIYDFTVQYHFPSDLVTKTIYSRHVATRFSDKGVN